jgi:hypothetical protein
VYDTLLELLVQKFSKTTEKRERDSLSQQILDLLKDPKVGIRAELIGHLHPARQSNDGPCRRSFRMST